MLLKNAFNIDGRVNLLPYNICTYQVTVILACLKGVGHYFMKVHPIRFTFIFGCRHLRNRITSLPS